MDEAIQKLRNDGASIIECIGAVKKGLGREVSDAKRIVNESKAWKDVVQGTIAEIVSAANTEVLFISSTEKEERLGIVAAKVFRALGIEETEERFSSNYPPDAHYFVGYSQNLELQMCDADDERTPEFPFRAFVSKATYRKGPGLIMESVKEMAEALANASLLLCSFRKCLYVFMHEARDRRDLYAVFNATSREQIDVMRFAPPASPYASLPRAPENAMALRVPPARIMLIPSK